MTHGVFSRLDLIDLVSHLGPHPFEPRNTCAVSPLVAAHHAADTAYDAWQDAMRHQTHAEARANRVQSLSNGTVRHLCRVAAMNEAARLARYAVNARRSDHFMAVLHVAQLKREAASS
jgi:hypothetical protein